MKANKEFLDKPISFWGYVRFISEQLGYSKNGVLRKYTIDQAVFLLDSKNISYDLADLESVIKYMNYRADILNNKVSNDLMNLAEAAEVFRTLRETHINGGFFCSLPMNKQKEDKYDFSFFTGIINILAETELRRICDERNLIYGVNLSFDDNPRGLCCIKDDENKIVFTLSRRFDGAFPSTTNTKAVWEIKEYYYTTTFGSRVADGVYETLLDGYEINSVEMILDKDYGIPNSIQHYYFIDDKRTWWDKGKSYLCRIIDMLHMGLVDEVMFGKEVLTEWPPLIRSLVEYHKDELFS